jgi:hypothetical protein
MGYRTEARPSSHQDTPALLSNVHVIPLIPIAGEYDLVECPKTLPAVGIPNSTFSMAPTGI